MFFIFSHQNNISIIKNEIKHYNLANNYSYSQFGVTVATQYEVPTLENTSLYKQLVFNYDAAPVTNKTSVLFQMEMTSPKPIVLTKTQYDKIKRTIQIHLSKHSNDKKRAFKRTSIISIGEVRRKIKNIFKDKSVQTDKSLTKEVRQYHDKTTYEFKNIQTSYLNNSNRSIIKTPLSESTIDNIDRADQFIDVCKHKKETLSSIEMHYRSDDVNYIKYDKYAKYFNNYASAYNDQFDHLGKYEGEVNCSIHTIFKGRYIMKYA